MGQLAIGIAIRLDCHFYFKKFHGSFESNGSEGETTIQNKNPKFFLTHAALSLDTEFRNQ